MSTREQAQSLIRSGAAGRGAVLRQNGQAARTRVKPPCDVARAGAAYPAHSPACWWDVWGRRRAPESGDPEEGFGVQESVRARPCSDTNIIECSGCAAFERGRLVADCGEPV